MAMPASTHQSYIAGSCKLDVTSQLSALSQWSARPIVQTLTFELWVDQATQPVLIAEGDREALQTLSNYIQQKTRRLLTVSALNAQGPFTDADDIQAPEILRLSQPLSYLQLCDVNSLLSQYEQATQTLPIQLTDVATPVAIAPATPTADNVISLAAARDHNTSRTTARPRKNRLVWASSAAAALFAVGLTSTLWSRDPNLQRTTVESAAPESIAEQSEQPLESAEDLSPASAEKPDNENLTDSGRQTITPRPNRTQNEQAQSDAANRPASSRPARRTPTVERAPTEEAVTPLPAPTSAIPESSAAETIPQADANPTQAEDVPNASSEQAATAAADAAGNTTAAQPSQPAAVAEPEPIALPPASPPADDSVETDNSAADTGSLRAPARARQEAVPSLEASATAEAFASPHSQIQSYFQSKWPLGEDNAETGPLSYELQISAAGEVISFVGLDDVSQELSDRILPADTPPTFPQTSSAEDSTESASPLLKLRIVLEQNGLVQIFEL